MPELRTDWLTGRTVLVAENRAERPNEFDTQPNAPLGEAASARLGSPQAAAESSASTSQHCPFCAGNESETPKAVYSRNDAHGRWRVRVVPNMYPAVSLESSAIGTNPNAQPALGAHEVIVESATHAQQMSALDMPALADVLAAYTDRLLRWRADGRFQYGLIFKNQGPRAGASLAHVHSQLIALPNIPAAVHRELERAERDFDEHGNCPYCRLIARERSDGQRIVFDGSGFIAFCPFASLQPLEVWLLPTIHEPWFEKSENSFNVLAEVLRTLIVKLESIVPAAAYNMLLRTSPWQSNARPERHWRIELLPRFTSFAGLELASGIHINPLPPEQAARRLRGS